MLLDTAAAAGPRPVLRAVRRSAVAERPRALRRERGEVHAPSVRAHRDQGDDAGLGRGHDGYVRQSAALLRLRLAILLRVRTPAAVGAPVAPAAVRRTASSAVRSPAAVSPVLVEQPAAAARHLRSRGDVANLRDFPGRVGAIGAEVKDGDDARLGSRVQSAPVLVHQHLPQRVRRPQAQDAREHAGQRAVVAHLPAPSLPPRVGRGVFNLVQSLVVAGEEDASAVGARDVLGDDVVRGAAVVEGVEGELVVQRRSLAAVAECASHEDNLHGGGHREDVVDGAEEDALFGLGEAHGDDGLLLAAVLHGHVVGPVQAPEEERVVHGGPGAIDLGQDAAEAHRLARRVPLQDDGRELARARRRNLGRPLRRNTNKRRDDGQCAVREPTDGGLRKMVRSRCWAGVDLVRRRAGYSPLVAGRSTPPAGSP